MIRFLMKVAVAWVIDGYEQRRRKEEAREAVEREKERCKTYRTIRVLEDL